MSQDVFNDRQLTAMTQAINQIMSEARGFERHEVAHAVFTLASKTGEFDPGKLAEIARQRLVRAAMKQTA